MRQQHPGVLLVAAACLMALSMASTGQELKTVNRLPVVAEPLPLKTTKWGEGVIFPPAFGPAFMNQCSRSTPGKADAYWMPEQADVEKAESVFASYRGTNSPGRELVAEWPDLHAYHRQYVGVLRGN